MSVSMRIHKIAGLLQKGQLLADIGTDHAYMPIEAVKAGMFERALACDIVPGPLERAEKNIRAAGLSSRIETRLGDGLLPLLDDRPDSIVITGMGGLLLRRILEEGVAKIKQGAQLVLSPQSELFEFREYLLQNGFSIIREEVVSDFGKYYTILDCRREKSSEVYSDYELRFGKKALTERGSESIREAYIRHEAAVAERILESLKNRDSKEIDLRRAELNSLLEDARKALVG